jgi:putative membrane protein
MNISGILVAWLVTAVVLLIISKLPLGVDIDGFGKALISAAVFGILNAFLKPILVVLTIPITLLTLGLFYLVLNALIFALASFLVEGFRLRWGFWSALFGSIALSLINSLIGTLIPALQ